MTYLLLGLTLAALMALWIAASCVRHARLCANRAEYAAERAEEAARRAAYTANVNAVWKD